MGDDSQEKAVGSTAAVATGAALGSVAIILIILAVIAGIILLAMMAAGVGIFAARRKLFNLGDHHVEGQIELGNAISVGAEFQMTVEHARGMLEQGAFTQEQFDSVCAELNGKPDCTATMNPMRTMG